jgi:hypothetical protein
MHSSIYFQPLLTESPITLQDFPAHHNKEAYSDAIPPAPGHCHRLTAYSDACWGGANLKMPSLSVSLSNYSNFAVCQVI